MTVTVLNTNGPDAVAVTMLKTTVPVTETMLKTTGPVTMTVLKTTVCLTPRDPVSAHSAAAPAGKHRDVA